MCKRIGFLTLVFLLLTAPSFSYETKSPEWVARYNGPGNSIDAVKDIGVDGEGNVYVTGAANGSSSSQNSDFITIKYNSAGQQQWVARYNGPGDGEDSPVALAVDGQGNVYVTGESLGEDNTNAYATIKYDKDGTQKWVARFDGPSAAPVAVAVDNNGNVIVTGSIRNVNSSIENYDFATVKYAADGSQIWVSYVDGTAGSVDYARALAVDNAGNIYVAGTNCVALDNQNKCSKFNYMTIKYSPAPQVEVLWIASEFDQRSRAVAAIAVDSVGNVYVTGRSWEIPSTYAYCTMKYNSIGEKQWTSDYNGPFNSSSPTAMTLDAAGNVYVTGQSLKSFGSGTGWGIATVKYNPTNGDKEWVANYDSGIYSDTPRAIAADNAGGIYVTGGSSGQPYQDMITIKYSSVDGAQQWVKQYNGDGNSYDSGVALAVDSSHNVHVAGSTTSSLTDLDFITIKYDSGGNQLWASKYNQDNFGDDYATATAFDTAGNVYVTGISYGADTGEDFVTIKYDASGNQQWVARYDGAGGWDGSSGIAVDALGNVYVTGTGYYAYVSGTPNTYYDFITIKYDAAGNQQWVAKYNGPDVNQYTASQDQAVAIALDTDGNAYVTGRSGYCGNGDLPCEWATVKYDTAGVQEWVARYNGGGPKQDEPRAIAVDSQGYVYVTGSICTEVDSGGYCSNSSYATVKYDLDGQQLWEAKYGNGPADGMRIPLAIATDAGGNVYVTGVSCVDKPEGSWRCLDSDFVTVKYDSAGTEVWARHHAGPIFLGDDIPRSIAIGSDGGVYVSGDACWDATTYGSCRRRYYSTVKYDTGGNELWSTVFSASEGSDNQMRAMRIDGLDNIYITGLTRMLDSSKNMDSVTVSYDKDGTLMWVAIYDGFGNADYGTNLAVDNFGNVVVAGTSGGMGTGKDIVAIKYKGMDAIPPSSTATVSPQPNSSGWNKSTVTITLVAIDNAGGSGVKEIHYQIGSNSETVLSASSASIAVSAEGSSTVNYFAVDNQGNIEQPKTLTVQIDMTMPTISFNSTCPSTVNLGTIASADVTVADFLSGVASQSIPNGPVALDTSTVGGKLIAITATDYADNQSSGTCSYQVIYDFSQGGLGGFGSPIEGPPTVNTAKAGGTIAIKWQLPDGHGGYLSDLSVVSSIQYQAAACTTYGTTENPVPTETSGNSGLHYDTSTNQFVYNWKTAKTMAGECYVLTLILNDGSQYQANFSLK